MKSMNISNDILCVGLFQVAQNLSEASAGVQHIDATEVAMPMPGADIAPRIEAVVDYMLQSGKKKFLLLSPEVAILSALEGRETSGLRFFIALPADMPESIFNQIRSNVPDGLDIQFVENLYVPGAFLPENGVVLTFGYMAKDYLMVRPEAYHMNKIHGSFPGQKVFVPYIELDNFVQPENWMRIRADIFNEILEV